MASTDEDSTPLQHLFPPAQQFTLQLHIHSPFMHQDAIQITIPRGTYTYNGNIQECTNKRCIYVQDADRWSLQTRAETKDVLLLIEEIQKAMVNASKTRLSIV